MGYKAAAEMWRQDSSNNPDGWYCDPEALCFLSECMAEADSREDALEIARRWWRLARDKFADSGSPAFAGEMVAIEQVVQRGNF